MNPFIIAIGYSAGGLDSLKKFFDATPCDAVSYVVLNHVPSTTVSHLKSILKLHSKLEVIELFENIPVENNKVYLVPPGHYLVMANDQLQIVPRSLYTEKLNSSIDTFLESLARQKSFAKIAVFFSGYGKDGAKGAALIKKAGGKILVQEPRSCLASNIPCEVMNATEVDAVALPEAMPAIIEGLVKQYLDKVENNIATSGK